MEEEKKPMDQDDVLDPNDFEEKTNKSADTDNPADKEETKKTDPESSKSDEEAEKAKKDAHFAKLRREREAQEKVAKERREQEAKERKIREEAKLEAELGIIKTNPYTDEPITDEEDLKVYKLQKELDEEGKDPIADLPRKIAQINRLNAKKAADEEAKRKQDEIDRQAKINAEIKELREKYPKVDTAKLAEDPLFKECLQGRAGRWSQTEIYEYYLGKKAEADKKAADEKAKNKIDEESKKMTKTPGSGSTIKSASDISNMSDEEFQKYWEKKYS